MVAEQAVSVSTLFSSWIQTDSSFVAAQFPGQGFLGNRLAVMQTRSLTSALGKSPEFLALRWPHLGTLPEPSVTNPFTEFYLKTAARGLIGLVYTVCQHPETESLPRAPCCDSKWGTCQCTFPRGWIHTV